MRSIETIMITFLVGTVLFVVGDSFDGRLSGAAKSLLSDMKSMRDAYEFR